MPLISKLSLGYFSLPLKQGPQRGEIKINFLQKRGGRWEQSLNRLLPAWCVRPLPLGKAVPLQPQGCDSSGPCSVSRNEQVRFGSKSIAFTMRRHFLPKGFLRILGLHPIIFNFILIRVENLNSLNSERCTLSRAVAIGSYQATPLPPLN